MNTLSIDWVWSFLLQSITLCWLVHPVLDSSYFIHDELVKFYETFSKIRTKFSDWNLIKLILFILQLKHHFKTPFHVTGPSNSILFTLMSSFITQI